MIRKIFIPLTIAVFFITAEPLFAYWVWTPESGKWENPKYATKDTPEEQFAYAQDYYKKGNFKVALKEFKKLIKHYPLSKEAPTAQYYTGRIMEDVGRPYDAFKAYQKVIDLYPYTGLVDEVIEREYKIGELFFAGEKINVLGPLKMSTRDKAIEIFKAVADNAPYGKYAEPAMYKAGLTYKAIADYNNAILMFKGLIDKYPNSELIGKARYELAECSKLMSLRPEYDQTPTEVAREEFEDFVQKHPDSEMTEEAKKIINKLKDREAENTYNIGQFYEARKVPASAMVYYNDIISNYPDTKWAAKARERLDELQKK